jgi:parallel beta-helix repeat protein
MARWLGAGIGGAAVAALTLKPEEAHATDLNVLDVDTMVILKALTPPQMVPRARVLLGYFTPGDGGGGLFCWDPDSMAKPNDGTVVKPDIVEPGFPGRWLRIFEGPVSVKWFGAMGEGAPGDAAAIQAALDSVSDPLEANPRGGEVFIPNGLYILRQALVIHSNCRLTGEGWGTVLKVEDNANPPAAIDRPAIRNLNFTLPLIGNTNIQIVNLAVDGNNENNDYTSYQAGIFLRYCRDVLIENVYVHHCLLVGITLVACERGVVHGSKMSANDSFEPGNADNAMGFQGQLSKQIKVTNCHSEYNERYGFQFWGSDSDQDDNVIANCTTKGNKGNGYSFTGGKRNKIINCSSIEDGGGPIVAGNEDSEIIGCTVFKAFSLSTNAGIHVRGAPRTRVIGNSISETSSGPGAGTFGIVVDTGSIGTIVDSNHITDTQGTGIGISNSVTTVSNNVILRSGGFGIFVAGSSETNVTNNRIERVSLGGIYVQNCDRVNIASNRVTLCDVGGISQEGGGKYLSIIGNHVSDCLQHGIAVGKIPAQVPGPDFHRIENNLILNNVTYGLRVLNSARCVISGNVIADDQAGGAQLNGLAVVDGGVPVEHIVTSNQFTGTVVPGAGTIMANNIVTP